MMVDDIQKALKVLNDAYSDANIEDEFGNFTGYSIQLFASGSGYFEARFYYSNNQIIYYFDNIVDLEKTLADIILDDGDGSSSDLVGFEFDIADLE